MRNKSAKFGIILLILTAFGFTSDSDIYFRINKSLDTFGRVYREITLNYVDEINPEEFIVEGINGMLNSLDPYTIYIDETGKKDIDIITNGKYGGIGATVGVRNGDVTIIDLLDGYSAKSEGLRIGDIIKRIDSVQISEGNYKEIGKYLKKEPGTKINIIIERPGVDNPLSFELTAQEIHISNIKYSGFYPENSSNAYIKLTSFSRSAGEEIKNVIMELSGKREISSIILDLRNNPGGLLDAAIDVCEKFLKAKSLIVSVKGRDDLNPRNYFAHEDPVAKNKKLIVLINENSASASEIVAGAIQDHDRGVILGQKSFGKGLVQTIVPLGLNTSLKLTTARYYTPSGRCIQKIDYAENSNLFENHTSIDKREYKTDNSRTVLPGGGINPDTTVLPNFGSKFIEELTGNGLVFNFATLYFNRLNPKSLNDINIENMFAEFRRYVKSANNELTTQSDENLISLKKSLKEEFSSVDATGQLNEISRLILEAKDKEMTQFKTIIIDKLLEEFAARISGRQGRIKESLENDQQLKVALDIVNNDSLYFNILNGNN